MNSQLSIREVAQYYGCRCVAEFADTGTLDAWQEAPCVIDYQFLEFFSKGYIRNIRPILKPIEAMTEEDAQKVLKATGQPLSEAAKVRDGATALSLLFSKKTERAAPFIFHQLDCWKYRNPLYEMGYDVDELITRGLAIDATKEAP